MTRELILCESRLFDDRSIVFVPAVHELPAGDGIRLDATILDRFCAELFDNVVSNQPGMRREDPFLTSRLPYYDECVNDQFFEEGKVRCIPKGTRHRINPFPRLFVQLKLRWHYADCYDGILYKRVQAWLEGQIGRKAYLFENSECLLIDLSRIRERSFYEIVYFEQEILNAKLWYKSLRTWHSERGVSTIGLKEFYQNCRLRERKILTTLFTGDQAGYLPADWIIYHWVPAFPCPYPTRHAFPKIPPGLAIVMAICMLLATVSGGIFILYLFVSKVVDILSFGGFYSFILTVPFSILIVYAQFRVFKSALSEKLTTSESNNTRIGVWATSFCGLTLAWTVFNIGYIFGIWGVYFSIGHLVGACLAVVFSPFVIGGSVLYALNSPVSDFISTACPLVPDLIGLTDGGGWLNFAKISLRAIYWVISSPIVDYELWTKVVGSNREYSIFSMDWDGISSVAVYLTHAISVIRCSLVYS